MVKIGQVWRDTYFDGKNERLTKRTIRITALAGDKAHAETLTDCTGTELAKPRKTRVAFKTLASGYELVA